MYKNLIHHILIGQNMLYPISKHRYYFKLDYFTESFFQLSRLLIYGHYHFMEASGKGT